MLLVDLHMHSSFSDGTVSPEIMAGAAKKQGISVASLTDHDTVEGVPAFLLACKRMGVRALSGVELSADFPTTMHILGYAFDHRNPDLLLELDELRRHRNERNAAMVKKLNGLGVGISMDDVLKESKGAVVTRPHVARAVMAKGFASSVRECFELYLGKGAPAYVPRKSLSPKRCLSLIRQAGGFPVLAHPFQTTRNMGELRTILSDLKAMGLWGVEGLSGRQSSEQAFRYMTLASDLGLQCTAGSDYHGANRMGVSMGVAVPEDLLPWARLGVSL